MTPAVPLCVLNMAEEGAGPRVTRKDIPGTLQGFVVLIPTFRGLESSYCVDQDRSWGKVKSHGGASPPLLLGERIERRGGWALLDGVLLWS